MERCHDIVCSIKKIELICHVKQKGVFIMSNTIKKDTSYLSKTLFIKGLQCHKALYLQKYHPELKGDVCDAKEAFFSSGRDVGVFAQQLFPGGVGIEEWERAQHKTYVRTMQKTR